MVDFFIESHPDGIRIRSSEYVNGEDRWDLHGTTDEDYWTTIGREAPELWDLMDEGNTSIDGEDDRMLFDEPRVWEFDDMSVAMDDSGFRVVMDEGDGHSLIVVPVASYEDARMLDEKTVPKESWEDALGFEFDSLNGIPCEADGTPTPWVVEVAPADGRGDTFCEYFRTQEEAADAADMKWHHLTDREKQRTIIRYGRIKQGQPGDIFDMEEITQDDDEEDARTPEEEIEERMPTLIMQFGLSVREAQAIILSDMGMGPQEIADTLKEITGTEMSRQSIANVLRKARVKMAIDRSE